MRPVLLFLIVFSFACGNAPAERNAAATFLEADAEGDAARQQDAERSSAIQVGAEQGSAIPAAAARRDSFTIAYLMGKFDPSAHPDFVKVDIAHADRDGHYLRRDTYEAFNLMYQAALKDGVKLKIISAARNFNRQKEIWEAKWNGSRQVDGADISKTIPEPVQRALKILEFSSMPGSSRHHWGTDIDLNALSDAYFLKGEGMKIFEWLSAHAHEYGFCRPYTAKGPDRPNGYFEEKWHWSYQPVAKQLTDLARTHLRDEMIEGFKGAETAQRIGVVQNYVLGVSGDCLR